jgi:fumarate hydratase class II
LSPVIGYQNAAHIAERAIAEGVTLKQAALESGKVDDELFEKTVRPIDMIGQGLGGA